MSDSKTHRLRTTPRISVRDLADYMAASEIAKRSIVRAAKYQPRARVIQHEEARSAVSKFIREGDKDITWLLDEADSLRHRLTDTPFERDLLDHNADYIQRVAEIWPTLPKHPGVTIVTRKVPPITLSSIQVTMDLHVRLQPVSVKQVVARNL